MNNQPTGYYFPPQPTPPKKKHTFAKVLLGVFLTICAMISLSMCISMCSSYAETNEAEETDAISVEEDKEKEETQATVTDTPTKTAEEIREEFIADCIEADYKDILRYPEKYKDQHILFSGKVIQRREDTSIFTGKTITLRVRDVDNIDIVWLIQYKDKEVITDGNILEDDIITIYGTCTGTTSYKSILGTQITIPSMTAAYIDRENAEESEHVQSGSYDVNGVSFLYEDHVRNDVTGSWRIAKCADMTVPAEIARELSETFKQKKGEVLWVINFTLKTTTRINNYGSYLEVTTLEYVEDEEHDAKLLGGGEVYTTEQVWLTEETP